MLDFATPLVFLLLPLPLLAWALLPPQEPLGGAVYLPEGIASASTSSGSGATRNKLSLALLILMWLALVMALAGPQRLVETPDVSASGREIMLTIDMSGSMLIEDFEVDGVQSSRLSAVKQVASRFVEQRAGDRIGLVLFADRAYVAAPLTFDLPAVSRAIEEASIGITGRSTAIADGLGLALKRLSESAAPSRVIVLLSDGRETADKLDAQQVARLASELGVRVHTVALGPEDLESQPASRDAVDTVTLRAIAEASGGRSYRVRGIEDLLAMAADLDRLEPNPSSRPPVIIPQPIWPWPAALALLAGLGFGLTRRVEA